MDGEGRKGGTGRERIEGDMEGVEE